MILFGVGLRSGFVIKKQINNFIEEKKYGNQERYNSIGIKSDTDTI